jgi:hypothetical protein
MTEHHQYLEDLDMIGHLADMIVPEAMIDQHLEAMIDQHLEDMIAPVILAHQEEIDIQWTDIQ